MKTSLPIVLGAACLVASCVTNPPAKPREKEPYKHELVQNRFGCWEFERDPEYVAYQYGNAMLGVGGTYIECMKSAIARHRQAAQSIAGQLAAVPDDTAEAANLRRRLQEENELGDAAVKTYADWRKRNWK